MAPVLLRSGAEFNITPTYPPIFKKTPVGKVVNSRQVSSGPPRDLLKCYCHPASLLSVPGFSGAGNISEGRWFVVRLVREGLVHEVREIPPKWRRFRDVDFEMSFGTPKEGFGTGL